MEPSNVKIAHLTARPPDGKVYLRVDKKQLIAQWLDRAPYLLENGAYLYHWCNTQSPERITAETPSHVCDLWKETTEEPEPEAPPKRRNRKRLPTIEDLMERVSYTQEAISIDPVPTLERSRVLASLYQALALETQTRTLVKIAHDLEHFQDMLDTALEQLQRTLNHQADCTFKIGAALEDLYKHFRNRTNNS